MSHFKYPLMLQLDINFPYQLEHNERQQKQRCNLAPAEVSSKIVMA